MALQFPLQLGCRLQQLLHLTVRILHVLGGIRSLSIPSPLFNQLRFQLALEHLCDVLAQHGEELEAVERTASGDVESLGGRVRRNDKVGGGGEGVPIECYFSVMPLRAPSYSPADSVFLHLPIRTRGSVPEIPGLNDVLLERSRNLPLVVVVCGRRRRNITARQHLASVCENLGSPPLELSILGWGNAANEGLAC